ncbi:unnamed protein product, partial [Iphiclides podalirius]
MPRSGVTQVRRVRSELEAKQDLEDCDAVKRLRCFQISGGSATRPRPQLYEPAGIEWRNITGGTCALILSPRPTRDDSRGGQRVQEAASLRLFFIYELRLLRKTEAASFV